MSAPLNRLPECVEKIVEVFSLAYGGRSPAEAMLARGVNADEAHIAGVDIPTLNCALNFGVVETDIGGYVGVDLYGFHSRPDGGVILRTAGDPIAGYRVTITIPRASHPETAVGSATPAHLSALIAWFGANPDAKKTDAEAEALHLDPSLSDNEKAREGILYLARHGAGLDHNFPPGAPRKNS
jgi:hypothetical protein